ncbi:MAG: hypothetical protein Kow00114_23680 [Kiloniellaceae bacterium]
MPFELKRQVRHLVASYGAHLGDLSSDYLNSLPRGWLDLVRGMLDRVEQVLCDSEQETFRWTALLRQRDCLVAQWAGAEATGDLVDQIVEETQGEARNTCVDCGASTLLGVWDADGPRCLFHATLQSGRGRIKDWNLATLELLRGFQESISQKPGVHFQPKTIAAALPLLIGEAAAYFRDPDQDAKAITQQLREALYRMEVQLRRSGRTSVQSTDS